MFFFLGGGGVTMFFFFNFERGSCIIGERIGGKFLLMLNEKAILLVKCSFLDTTKIILYSDKNILFCNRR